MARRRKMSNAVSKTVFQKNVNKINTMNLSKPLTQGGYRM